MAGAIVIGAGPGLGAAIARRFARAGLPVAAVARGASVADLLADPAFAAVDALALRADAADESALGGALDQAVAAHGVPDALVYNAAVIRRDRPGELTAGEHLAAWSVNVLGAYTAATRLGPAMAARGRGAVLLTGGMPAPDARFTGLSLGKAGLRALAELLRQEYGPRGVHVATVTVDGVIAAGTDSDPELIAEHYWTLFGQPRSDWESERTHTCSTRV